MDAIKQPGFHGEGQAAEKLLGILKICQEMNSERDLGVLLILIARESTSLMEADRASIFLLDQEKGELWSQVALDSEPIRFDAHVGIAGAAALTGQIINVEDAYRDPRFYPEVDNRTGYRTQSLLAVPLRNHEGEILGTFQVLNKKGGAFSEDDEEMLKALASQAAIAIETARLLQELRQSRDQLLRENTHLWKEVEGRRSARNVIGTSEKIQQNLKLTEQIRDSSVNVLITGESGTGKELLARAIHYSSPRAGPFVALNCAALPEALVESELFGIEKGIATGVERRIGKFEEADGGTLFLDEIGDLSLTAQAKILRVLQERVVERVGARRGIPVDVRVLSATKRDLESEIRRGTFREDLYYRLKLIHVHMPALREIREDIPLLATHFLDKYCREMNKEAKKLSPGALRCLVNYPWPGNVRELENEIKRVVVLAQRSVVTEEDLSESLWNSAGQDANSGLASARLLKATVEEVERRLILEALQTCHQNQVHASKALGVSRQGLIKKMKRYGIRAS
ncbi:MAG: sigma 54-interacting transcriptional regulator [Candidatus Methylomirabilia bacterium]